MHYKKAFGDRVFDFIVGILTVLVICCTLYPLIYTLSMSISDPLAVASGKVWLLPVGFSLKSFEKVFTETGFLRYFFNTVFYTVAGTCIGIFVTCLAAYPLSRTEFLARKKFRNFFLFTMFVNGGMIPTYIVITRFLHMYDTVWAILLPPVSAAWYVVVATSFFQSLPGEIVESARIDGASEYRIFGQLIMPLSKPGLAVLALYYSVGYWNSYMPALLYLSNEKLHPLSMYIKRVVMSASLGQMGATITQADAETILAAGQVKYSALVVTVLPMMLIYPYLSKYLEKGLMIGALKG